MRATIKDVAKLAGVSTATVSHVLTGKKFVSPPLLEKVRRAMEQLSYNPNAIARSLKVNRTFSIGVVVPDILNPFFSEVIKNVERVADQHQYQIVLCNSDESPEKEKKIIETFLHSGVDGIINVTSRMMAGDLAREMPVPMVIVDQPYFVTDENIFFVHADNGKGAAAVADHFVDRGYQRFICIAGPVDKAPVAHSRLQGFQTRLLARGVAPQALQAYTCKFSFDDGYATMARILQHYDPASRTAVFVCSDIMAWGAVEAAKTYGLKIPADIGISGYDNITFSRFIESGMTTVENSVQQMCSLAVRRLLEILECNGRFHGEHVLLDASLVIRKTT